MASAEYAAKLRNPNWQKKRLELFQRDGFRCVGCRCDSKELHLHHLYYVKGREPWDYPDWSLVTCCEECHSETHSQQSHQMIWEAVSSVIFKDLSFINQLHDLLGNRADAEINGETIRAAIIAALTPLKPESMPVEQLHSDE